MSTAMPRSPSSTRRCPSANRGPATAPPVGGISDDRAPPGADTCRMLMALDVHLCRGPGRVDKLLRRLASFATLVAMTLAALVFYADGQHAEDRYRPVGDHRLARVFRRRHS